MPVEAQESPTTRPQKGSSSRSRARAHRSNNEENRALDAIAVITSKATRIGKY